MNRTALNIVVEKHVETPSLRTSLLCGSKSFESSRGHGSFASFHLGGFSRARLEEMFVVCDCFSYQRVIPPSSSSITNDVIVVIYNHGSQVIIPSDKSEDLRAFLLLLLFLLLSFSSIVRSDLRRPMFDIQNLSKRSFTQIGKNALHRGIEFYVGDLKFPGPVSSVSRHTKFSFESHVEKTDRCLSTYRSN